MILGITGGIASGKTLATRIFRQLGAVVVSADDLAREVVAPGSPTLARLAERFGAGILLPDGALDRAALAVARLRESAAQERPLIVYEAPLLYEAGAEGRVDAVLVVTVSEENQVQRLMARDGLTRRAALERIAAQMPQAEKAARADFVIDNDGTPEELEAAVGELFRRLSCVKTPE